MTSEVRTTVTDKCTGDAWRMLVKDKREDEIRVAYIGFEMNEFQQMFDWFFSPALEPFYTYHDDTFYNMAMELMAEQLFGIADIGTNVEKFMIHAGMFAEKNEDVARAFFHEKLRRGVWAAYGGPLDPFCFYKTLRFVFRPDVTPGADWKGACTFEEVLRKDTNSPCDAAVADPNEMRYGIYAVMVDEHGNKTRQHLGDRKYKQSAIEAVHDWERLHSSGLRGLHGRIKWGK